MLKKRALPTPACIPVAKSAYRLGSSRGGSRAPLGPIPTPVADDGMMLVVLLFFFDGLVDDFLFVGLLDFFDAVGMDDDDVTDSNKFVVVSVALGVGVKLYDADIPVLGVVIPPPPLGDGNAEISSGVVIIETFGVVDTRVMAAGGGARDVILEVFTVIADAETPPTPPPPLSPLPDAERTLSLTLSTVVAVVVAGTSTTVPSGANATGPAGRSANGSSSPVLNPPNVGVSG